MGTGDFGTDTAATGRASFGSLSYINGPTPSYSLGTVTNSAAWDVQIASTRTVRWGGPGTNRFDNYPATKGGC
jgi:hypothetical protein